MFGIWKEIGVFEITDQKLADEARMIRVNEWLSAVELEEIRGEVSHGIQECENVENPDMMVNEYSRKDDLPKDLVLNQRRGARVSTMVEEEIKGPGYAT